MRTHVRSTIQRYNLIPAGSHVLAGVSGGADSVALLHVLHSLRSTLDMDLTVVHVNHGLRGAEADAEAEFVQSLAGRLGVPCVVEKVAVAARARAEGSSVEMAGRAARYEVFARVARTVGADRVAVAHHADDQVETLLLRLLRGTSLRGLGGMRPCSTVEGLRVIRPMLEVRHAEAVAFLKAHHLAWREDASNADVALLRNRIRHTLLPFLEQEFHPSVRANLLRTASVLRDEQDWLEKMTSGLARRCRAPGGGLRVDALQLLPAAARRRILLDWLLGHGIPAERMEWALLERVDAWLHGTAPRLSLPGRSVVERTDGVIHVQGKVTGKLVLSPVVLKIPGETVIPELQVRVKARLGRGFKKTNPGERLAYFSEERRAGAPLVIRTRRPGDRMQPFGLTGSVKLQDVLVDLKVPRAERDRVPVVTCRDEIVWIPGYRIARAWAVSGPSKPSVRLAVLKPSGF